MSLRLFSSEAYSEPERDGAWRDLLGEFDLATSAQYRLSGHATALWRGQTEAVSLLRFTAAPQILTPRPNADEAPLAFLLLEGDVMLADGSREIAVTPGRLTVLPRRAAWRLNALSGFQGVLLAVGTNALAGRSINTVPYARACVLPEGGLSDVLCSMITQAAASLDQLDDRDWPLLCTSVAELLLGCLRKHEVAAGGSAATSAQVLLLGRIQDTIEHRLHEPDLTPGRVAALQGVSERYLQKILEGAGQNFSALLRERRLQHCRADLSNPAEARFSVSEIAFRRGFNDAAHFSRSFRERFGIAPREFRQQQAKRSASDGLATEQRGWPRDALAQMRAVTDREPGVLRGATSRSVDTSSQHVLAATAQNVHWGFFSRALAPRLTIASGDTVVVETLTQHASDDPERMIDGDPGALDVFRWTATEKTVDRRGAGPMDASVFGRGAGEGFGVHICTGPIAIDGAEPGDVLEVRILDMVPRRSRSADHDGRVFGSSVAAWWGYHYGELLAEPRKREVVTIYEIFPDDAEPHARALYAYRWQPQTDPFGTVHQTYDYPGVPIRPGTVRRRHAVLAGVKIPLRPHFGVIAVAPRETELVDSVPPSYFGGNLDNWRLGKGATVYLPVSVPGALLSVGDPHAAQGDGELAGTAIECSMTGTLQVILHKRATLDGSFLADVNYPLIETSAAWVFTGFSYPNYLAELGTKGQSEVYAKSSLDLAFKDAFRKVRRFLMNIKELSEDEAIALISAAVDFGVTQVVDGNWGVHATLSKSLFEDDNLKGRTCNSS